MIRVVNVGSDPDRAEGRAHLGREVTLGRGDDLYRRTSTLLVEPNRYSYLLHVKTFGLPGDDGATCQQRLGDILQGEGRGQAERTASTRAS
jgi:hypothetical protein